MYLGWTPIFPFVHAGIISDLNTVLNRACIPSAASMLKTCRLETLDTKRCSWLLVQEGRLQGLLPDKQVLAGLENPTFRETWLSGVQLHFICTPTSWLPHRNGKIQASQFRNIFSITNLHLSPPQLGYDMLYSQVHRCNVYIVMCNCAIVTLRGVQCISKATEFKDLTLYHFVWWQRGEVHLFTIHQGKVWWKIYPQLLSNIIEPFCIVYWLYKYLGISSLFITIETFLNWGWIACLSEG